MSIIGLIEDVIDEAFDIVDDARHDWYFAKRQMDSMQRTSLRREED